MTAYEQGFMAKCAEYGIDESSASRMMKKGYVTKEEYRRMREKLLKEYEQEAMDYGYGYGDLYGSGTDDDPYKTFRNPKVWDFTRWFHSKDDVLERMRSNLERQRDRLMDKHERDVAMLSREDRKAYLEAARNRASKSALGRMMRSGANRSVDSDLQRDFETIKARNTKPKPDYSHGRQMDEGIRTGNVRLKDLPKGFHYDENFQAVRDDPTQQVPAWVTAHNAQIRNQPGDAAWAGRFGPDNLGAAKAATIAPASRANYANRPANRPAATAKTPQRPATAAAGVPRQAVDPRNIFSGAPGGWTRNKDGYWIQAR